MRIAAICAIIGLVIATPAASQSTDQLSFSDASKVTGVPLADVRFFRARGRGLLDGAIRISARIDRTLAWRSHRNDQAFLKRIENIYFTSPKQSLLAAMKSIDGKHKVKNRFLVLTHAFEQINSGKATRDGAGRLFVGARPGN